MQQITAGQAAPGTYRNTKGATVQVTGRAAPSGYVDVEADGEQLIVPASNVLLVPEAPKAAAAEPEPAIDVATLVGKPRHELERVIPQLTDTQLVELADLDCSMTVLQLVADEQDRRAGAGVAAEPEPAPAEPEPEPETAPPDAAVCPWCTTRQARRWSASRTGVAVFGTHRVGVSPCEGASRAIEDYTEPEPATTAAPAWWSDLDGLRVVAIDVRAGRWEDVVDSWPVVSATEREGLLYATWEADGETDTGAFTPDSGVRTEDRKRTDGVALRLVRLGAEPEVARKVQELETVREPEPEPAAPAWWEDADKLQVIVRDGGPDGEIADGWPVLEVCEDNGAARATWVEDGKRTSKRFSTRTGVAIGHGNAGGPRGTYQLVDGEAAPEILDRLEALEAERQQELDAPPEPERAPEPEPEPEPAAPADPWGGAEDSAARREIVKLVVSTEVLDTMEATPELQERVRVEIERQRKGLAEVQEQLEIALDQDKPLAERAAAADVLERIAGTKRAQEQRPGMLRLINRYGDLLAEVRRAHRAEDSGALRTAIRERKAGIPPEVETLDAYPEAETPTPLERGAAEHLHNVGRDTWPVGLPTLLVELTGHLRDVRQILPDVGVRAEALGLEPADVVALAISLERANGGRTSVLELLDRQLRRYGGQDVPEPLEDQEQAPEPAELAEDTEDAPVEPEPEVEPDAVERVDTLPFPVQLARVSTARALELAEEAGATPLEVQEALEAEAERKGGPRPLVVEALRHRLENAAEHAGEPARSEARELLHRDTERGPAEAEAPSKRAAELAAAAPMRPTDPVDRPMLALARGRQLDALQLHRKPDGSEDLYVLVDGSPRYVGPADHPDVRPLAVRLRHALQRVRETGREVDPDVAAAQQALAMLAAGLPALSRLGVDVELKITTRRPAGP